MIRIVIDLIGRVVGRTPWGRRVGLIARDMGYDDPTAREYFGKRDFACLKSYSEWVRGLTLPW